MTLNPDKVKDEAIKIIKNSDINLEDVLIKIPANNLPDCTIISIFEIDDNYYRVFSVCSQLKDQFH